MDGRAKNQAKPVAVTTAGLRGTRWDPSRLPADTRMTVHALVTHDGADVTGYLFRRGGESTVVCTMHPREINVAQYLVPDLLNAGVAVWVQGARSPGNDIRLEHETALLDLAAGQKFLREQGFERTILQGISGGGPLAAFYCQQSARAPDARIKRSPGGKPTGLDKARLPEPDGVILISSHLGQGELLLRCIDPAVTDENDPLKTDESLSAFNPANGYREPPQSSSYAPEFLARYGAAQRERVARIDAFARAALERKAAARRTIKDGGGSRQDAIVAAYSPIFNVWRTDADLRCFDLSLEPTERAYGTLWGANQVASNYGSVGFARVCTPESWLSNWSALSSNASMAKCAPDVRKPVLMIEYTGDNSVFPSEANVLFEAIGARHKERHRVHGNHHGRPVEAGRPNGQIEAGRIIADWLRKGKTDL